MRDTQQAGKGRGRRPKLRGAAACVAAVGLLTGITAAFAPAAMARSPLGSRTVPARGTRALSSSQHPRQGRFLGIIRPRSRRTGYAPAVTRANGSPPLTYHGGPVQHSTTVYAIFWQPSGYYVPASFRSAIGQYFTDVSNSSFRTSNVYAASTQYYDRTGPGGTKNWVSYNVTFGGSIIAADPTPVSRCRNYRMGDGNVSRSCLTDSQLGAEIRSVIAAHNLPTGVGYEYFLFTPKDLADCFDARLADGCDDPHVYSRTAYCAYHSWIGTSVSSTILYAVEPWADLSGGCIYAVPHSAAPNDDGADVAINLASHENIETMTDPLGSAWFDKTGAEIADECAWLPLPTHYNGIGDYSQKISGDEYLMQFEWSNRAKACVGASTYPQPSGSLSAGASGSPLGESFAASAADSDDTAFSYEWQFGDGTGTGASASPNATHTYASSGSYTVTLIIFDAHGDQVRVSQIVAVS
jgi:hypothetical protein